MSPDSGSGSRFRTVRLDELERVPLDDGWWRPIRRRLGVSAFGVNAYSAAEAGDPLIEEHDEASRGAGGHEELYLAQQGSATFEVDGELMDAPQGTLLLVEPGVMRKASAAEAETTVLVIGGRPGAGLPPSPFEYWYAAIPASEAGDHARAYEIVAEGSCTTPSTGRSITCSDARRPCRGAAPRRSTISGPGLPTTLGRGPGPRPTPTSMGCETIRSFRDERRSRGRRDRRVA